MRRKVVAGRPGSRTKRKPSEPRVASNTVSTPHPGEASNTGAAGEESSAPEDVGCFVSGSAFTERLMQFEACLFRLVPQAIRVYTEDLESRDSRARARTATRLLQGVGLFRKAGMDRFFKTLMLTEEERRLIHLGELADMIINREREKVRRVAPAGITTAEESGKSVSGSTSSKSGTNAPADATKDSSSSH
jgi:hypothetical protein